MRLRLRNILKIEAADIEIGGLTVLTGENDSGKSTVGKILFSVLKAANNVRQVDRIKTVSLIRSELLALKKMFHKAENLPDLADIQGLSISLADKLISVEELHAALRSEAERLGFSSRLDAMLRNRISCILEYVTKLENPKVAVKEEFEAIAKSEFVESLNSYGFSDSSIEFTDDTTGSDGSGIEIHVTDGRVTYVNLWGTSSVEDVTYIESPLYLPILNTLLLSSPIPTVSLRGLSSSLIKGSISYHLADMAEKILSTADDLSGMIEHGIEGEDYSLQLSEISKLIGGEFVINSKTRQLSFNKGGHVVPTISVASGIKSFGVLQRLIQADCVSTYKMLIWDEPEIHLHPEWQIVFSRIIVELAAKGIPIVVSSHSPYFVQALRYFAAARGIEKEVKYYMARSSEETGLCRVKDVTDDLNRVFTRLAAPLREIMNVDAVRNSLR